jgi:hypothetical protein
MEVLPDPFFNFRKNIYKNRFATPISETKSSKINTFRGRFLKVRKTGKRIFENHDPKYRRHANAGR